MASRFFGAVAAACVGFGCVGLGSVGLAVPAHAASPILPSIMSQRFAGEECEAGSTDVWTSDPDLEASLATDLVPVDAIHAFFRGDGVRVAIIDSGIEPSNPALDGADIEKGLDLTGDDNAHTDPYGHGTAVASIIAGQPDSRAPIDGVAPDATIVPVKIMGTPPREVTEDYSRQMGERLVEGIRWATEQGVDVINISASVESSNAELEDAIADAVYEGVVVVASAGNVAGQVPDDYDPMEDRPRYPASYDGVLSVTAVDAYGLPSSRVLHSETQDIAGPGNFYVVANGSTGTCLTALDNPSTSYSAAYASGVVALLISAHPDESNEEIIYRLTTTAVRPDPSKKDFLTAWGIVDPTAAINFVEDGTAPGPDAPNYNRRVPPEPEGRAVPTPDPDPLEQSQEAGSVWAAAGVLGAVALLVAAAGIGRMARPDETDKES